MKVVRLNGNIVAEIIPEYALPVEYWYGEGFANACRAAEDDVEVGWIYDEETGTFVEPPAPEYVEPEEPTEAEPTTEELLNILMGVDEE